MNRMQGFYTFARYGKNPEGLHARRFWQTDFIMIPYIALFSWPLVSIAFFRRYSTPVAVLVTILAGYLLLPEKTSVDLPMLPGLGKRSIPTLTALVLSAVVAARTREEFPVLPGLMSRLWGAHLLVGLLVFGAFMTVMTNSDMVREGGRVLPPLRPYDAFSNILSGLMFLLPVLLARKYLASPQAHRVILLALCIAGLGYSLLILVELRMSPLLHYWIYGSFPHSWIQHVRGGWRPVVFLGHGLLLGIFLSATILAAAALARSWRARRGQFVLATVWLLIILVLSKNLGALMIALILLPCVLFMVVRMQLVVAAVITAVFLTYPVVRDTRIVPIDDIVEFAAGVDPARAASLLVRLKNEDMLLDKVGERLLFGWGGWGRSRIYHDRTGDDITIADGAWIITLSTGGWAGYVARFGLICVPVFLLVFRQRRLGVGPETAALTLILAGNMVDCIPNSSISPITAIVAGALWGRAELATSHASEASTSEKPTDAPAADPVAVSPYTRQTRRIERVHDLRR